MSRVYEALRKLGAPDPGHASKAERPHATVEGDEIEWPGPARPPESRQLGSSALQWPPPDPSGDGAPADGDVSGGRDEDPTSRVTAGASRAVSFSELIRAIARDEQDLGY